MSDKGSLQLFPLRLICNAEVSTGFYVSVLKCSNACVIEAQQSVFYTPPASPFTLGRRTPRASDEIAPALWRGDPPFSPFPSFLQKANVVLVQALVDVLPQAFLRFQD